MLLGRPSPFTLRKRIRPVVLYGFVALACLLTVTTWVVDEVRQTTCTHTQAQQPAACAVGEG